MSGKWSFNPLGPSRNKHGRVDVRNVRCEHCPGAMAMCTSRLVAAMGKVEYKCDGCGARYVIDARSKAEPECAR